MHFRKFLQVTAFVLFSSISLSCSPIRYTTISGKLYRDFGEIAHCYSDTAADLDIALYHGFDFFDAATPATRRDIPKAVRKAIAPKNGKVLFILREYLSPAFVVVQQKEGSAAVDTTAVFSKSLGTSAKPVFRKQQWRVHNGQAYLVSAFATDHRFLKNHQDTASGELAENTLQTLLQNWKPRAYIKELAADTELLFFQKVSKVFWHSKNNYLYPFAVPTPAKRDYDYYEGASFFNSFIGEYALALRQKDSIPEKKSDTLHIPAYTLSDALQTIADSARHHRVVMLNEAHIQPLHRRFAAELVQKLAPLGFKHLFVETLDTDSGLAERGFPVQEDGYYLAEPHFGNFLRTALQNDYTLHAYDNEQDGLEREKGQAAAVAAFLKKSPDKVIVYCGYAHLSEDPQDSLMGSFLKERSGEDPLTISQTEFTERGTPEYESPLYRAITANALVERPMIVHFPEKEKYADLFVLHPRTTFFPNGLPSWLPEIGKDTMLRLSFKEKKYEGCLLQLFSGAESKKESYWNLIPVLNTRITVPFSLDVRLNHGSYQLMVTDVYRNVVFEEIIKL